MTALPRRLVLGLAAAAAALPARAADGDDAGLARLAALVEKHLAAKRKGAAPVLPWRESILTPDTARLVWYGRSLAARPGAETTYRVALDPATRWYFVAQLAKGAARPRYFGPLEETAKGGIVEAFSAAAAEPKASK